jgi:hypothetical protein
MFESHDSRRDFLKKTAYVTPLILTMNVSLAEAQAGSGPPVERAQDFSTPLDPPSGAYANEGGKTYKGKKKDKAWKHQGKKKKKDLDD